MSPPGPFAAKGAAAPLAAFEGATSRLSWIRETIARMSYEAKSAHLGSSLSCVEIVDAILSSGRFEGTERDRLIVSKGHAAMAVYASLAAHGLMPAALLDGYLTNESALWGHVTQAPAAPVIDASTGSLGHGLGLGCGHCYGDRVRGKSRRVFVVLSDGECDEGSTWEAASFAGHHALGQLTAVVDYNKIQSLDRCEDVLTKEPFAARWTAFGWDADEVDGHDPEALAAALVTAGTAPRVVIAHTVKGRGIPRIEGTVASHYHPARAEDVGGQKR
jgi:transketolase